MYPLHLINHPQQLQHLPAFTAPCSLLLYEQASLLALSPEPLPQSHFAIHWWVLMPHTLNEAPNIIKPEITRINYAQWVTLTAQHHPIISYSR